MRTKTLAVCAAVLAAGALSSMAQSNVYSLNIVGYANVPTPGGFTFQSNPFDNSNNTATVLFPNPSPDGGASNGPRDGDNIQEWNGAGWDVTVFDALTDDTSTGYTTVGGAPKGAPTLGSGKGYLYFNNNAANTNTYVGNVRMGTNNLAIPVRVTPYALGSMAPLAGTVTSIGLVNPNPDRSGNTTSGPLDGCNFQSLRVNGAGLIAGFNVTVWDSFTDDTSSGFTTVGGAPAPEPSVTIGQGFFLVNSSPQGTYTWTQIVTNAP